MYPLLPTAVQTALHLAGVIPVFLPGLNARAWLSDSIKVDNHPVLFIDTAVNQPELEEIADWVLAEAASSLTETS